MDPTFLRQLLIDRMRHHAENIESAAASIARGLNLDPAVLATAVDSIRREGRRNMLLDSPPGVYDNSVEAEARMAGWYTGPEDGDEFWPHLRANLESSGMADVVDDIDEASTKVVAHLADPHIHNLSKRGLVVGYVQSGKTANYTAVMAKAADAGYRLFIVLSGLHNNLRRQTQVRLTSDLVDSAWAPLTSNSADFGNVINGAAMLSKDVKALAVVKKNQSRLVSLRNWLRDIPAEIRRRVPVLLLDDEADQATPNSATGQEQLTRINQLVREIWHEILTGTYVGYTATPFANIFMDPNDEEDLYPADFIINLPRPADYFGAERVFGREPLDEADDPEPGLDMVREVPDDDALHLRPPTDKVARAGFSPEIPPSLEDAVAWFLVATAIRWARGQTTVHSSMLVHTTHYIQPHFAMRDRLNALLDRIRGRWQSGDERLLRNSYDSEAQRVAEVATLPMPTWDAVVGRIPRVLERVRVVVDNGSSEDRLDYGREDEDGPVVETVIAVGGGTLSRGLTLEGLVVSYFTRTSNTYDTLLQMARWFGYRPGYEDLPRIWMQPSLAEEFQFLALVEEEIRQDMHHMERMQVTPRELGVRVRAHPGRLAIVARNKMRHADIVRITYSGRRLQTFIFNESSDDVIASNRRACVDFIHACSKVMPAMKLGRLPRWAFQDVPSSVVTSLLSAYRFHDDQVGLRADHMIGWIERAALDKPWNVVVAGSDKIWRRADESVIQLGEVEVGLPDLVPCVNRAPLINPPVGTANIKALLSRSDWFADIPAGRHNELDLKDDPQDVRRRECRGRGLVILYPISRNSVPLGRGEKVSRRPMEAPDHLYGLGLIFPDVDQRGYAADASYYSVHPDWQPEVRPEEDDIPDDTEDTLSVDGEKVAGGR